MVPLATPSIGDSELIIHFQEVRLVYARLFPNCYNKKGIQSNLPSYTPMNQGIICAKVYPEGIQPIKGNNCGLIPVGITVTYSVCSPWMTHENAPCNFFSRTICEIV